MSFVIQNSVADWKTATFLLICHASIHHSKLALEYVHLVCLEMGPVYRYTHQ